MATHKNEHEFLRLVILYFTFIQNTAFTQMQGDSNLR